MKAVINYVLGSKIANDHFGTQKQLLYNSYDCTELSEIIFEDMNLIGGETFRNSIIGFPLNDKWLASTKGAERVTYRRL